VGTLPQRNDETRIGARYVGMWKTGGLPQCRSTGRAEREMAPGVRFFGLGSGGRKEKVADLEQSSTPRRQRRTGGCGSSWRTSEADTLAGERELRYTCKTASDLTPLSQESQCGSSTSDGRSAGTGAD
jgi:hypothetical protein